MISSQKRYYILSVVSIMMLFLLGGMISVYADEVETRGFDGHTYAFVEGDLSWTEALNYCKEKGGHLVTITSVYEQVFLENAFPSTSGWIGFYSDGDAWNWVTGEKVEYTNWDPGEPNNSYGDEWYAHIRSDRSMQWNDLNDEDSNYHYQSGFYIEWDYSEDDSGFDSIGNTAEYNSHRYAYFEGESISWSDAREFCRKYGGHLVTITSEEEQRFLETQYSDTSGWIGFYNDKTTWFWVTGETLNYTNWESGEPNNSNGDEWYAHIWSDRSMRWNDLNNEDSDYHYQHGFYCEWDNLKDTGNHPPSSRKNSEWADEEIIEAEKEDLIPDSLVDQDLTLPVNRIEFAGVAVKTFENLTGVKTLPVINNPFSDTDDLDVLKAYNVGITNGTSATTFDPHSLLSREQCATMLTRVFKRATLAGWTLDTDSQFHLEYTVSSLFADDADISDWARDSVYFMAANGIINGIGDNRFAPRNTTTEQEARGYANATREQALAIAVRMVRNLK